MLKWVALAAVALPVPVLRAAAADDATAAPATQPTAAAADRHDQGATKVLLLPFQAVGGRPSDSWIGRSIQQSLLTDLVMGGPIRVSSSSTGVTEPNAAIDVGKNAGARYVVYGQVHVNDRGDGAGSAVRITAQVLDTSSGRPVGVLKSTGSIDDLFPVEDELAEQARRQLTRLQYAAGLEADRGAAAGGGEPRPTIEASGPVRMGVYSNPDWMDSGSGVPSSASYRYYYGNPYNWYEYTPAPAYSYPTPNYGAMPYYYGGSVSYGISRSFVPFDGSMSINPGTPGMNSGVNQGPIFGSFARGGNGGFFPPGTTVFRPNPIPAAGPVPNQAGVAVPRSFPGHVFHGKTYGQTLGVQ
jgi:TolB-like protein